MTSPSLEPASLIGKTLGERYRVVRKLASGGMATLFEAVHVTLGLRVAIKMLAQPFAQNPVVVARFLNEARALALLDHPNIVRVVDFDLIGKEPYMVLELLAGETLASRLAHGKIPLDVALRIAAQVGSAVSAAHEKGIVHRDLKPDNVFLSPRRDSLVVKLLDFGISRFVDARESRVTQDMEVVGTPEYMAPEQAQGRGDVDARADQYSLALLMYEMLTGCSPFEDDRPEESLRRVILEVPPSADQLDSAASPAVSRVLDRALSKCPEDRFASVDEFVAALSAASGIARPYSIAPEVNNDSGGVANDPDTAPTVRFRSKSKRDDPFAVSSSMRPEDAMRWLVGTIGQVQLHLAAREIDAATSLTMKILDAAELLPDPSARALIALSHGLFESVFRARLEPIDRVILVERTRVGDRRAESPAAAFLLARLEDWMTVEDVLDFAGPLRLPSLRVLVELEEQGVVRLPRTSTMRALTFETVRKHG